MNKILIDRELLEAIEMTWRVPHPESAPFNEKGERMIEEGLSQVRSLLADQAGPDGFVLVPVTPTIEMIAALGFGGDVALAVGHAAISEDVEQTYKAMLATRPTA